MNVEAVAVKQRWVAMRSTVEAGLFASRGTKAGDVIRLLAELINEAVRVIDSLQTSDLQQLVADYETNLHLLRSENDELRRREFETQRVVREVKQEMEQLRTAPRWTTNKKLRDIADVIGEEPAYSLVQKWGGRVLHIPNSVTGEHLIVAEIGFLAASILCQTFGGQQLYIPIERNSSLDDRNSTIVAKARAGISRMRIAQESGLTKGRVTQILDKLAPELSSKLVDSV